MMDAIEMDPVSLGLGFLIGILLIGLRLFAVERRNAALHARMQAYDTANTQMDSQFKVTAQNALREAHESFLQLAQENFKKNQAENTHDLDKRRRDIENMIKPVQEHLKALSGAVDRSQGMYKALHQNMQGLSKETARLAGALRNPAARGNWGEDMLERLLENSGLLKNVHYTLQPTLTADTRTLRPDAIINLPESLHVVIDAKAPVNDFIRHLDDDLDDHGYKDLQTGLAKAVKGHIAQLGKKAYWEHLNAPDFVVLFLPSEHLFSAAVQADPSLLDFAADHKIVMASPVLTMSLLRVVGMSWRQVEMAKNAEEISRRGEDLYKRLLSFTGHIEKIGKNLQAATRGYNDAVGSLERTVMPAARKFRHLQGKNDTKNMDTITPLDTEQRPVTLHQDDERERRALSKGA